MSKSVDHNSIPSSYFTEEVIKAIEIAEVRQESIDGDESESITDSIELPVIEEYVSTQAEMSAFLKTMVEITLLVHPSEFPLLATTPIIAPPNPSPLEMTDVIFIEDPQPTQSPVNPEALHQFKQTLPAGSKLGAQQREPAILLGTKRSFIDFASESVDLSSSTAESRLIKGPYPKKPRYREGPTDIKTVLPTPAVPVRKSEFEKFLSNAIDHNEIGNPLETFYYLKKAEKYFNRSIHSGRIPKLLKIAKQASQEIIYMDSEKKQEYHLKSIVRIVDWCQAAKEMIHILLERDLLQEEKDCLDELLQYHPGFPTK